MPVTEVQLSAPFTRLPRGGILVETSVGYVQFGAPPETIKDTMLLPRSAPQIFVLPNHFFHVEKGISVAELEFPIYYNHFLRQKKTYIVCTREQREQLMIVLKESVFGPEIIDLRSEYIDGENSVGFPNMVAEVEHFRGNRQLDDLVKFVIFRDDQVQINNVQISKLANGNFELRDTDWDQSTEIPGTVDFNIIYDTGTRLPHTYNPPLLGITCLGPSHGFDPEENTSGFLLWINHQGLMVDPPVNSTEWLRQSNINPKLINSIILTHCHADHDAGTFQKILEEGKITIYSTETVMHSFVRKYHGLTRIPVKELFSLFDFVPVVIGRTYIINGAEFRFSYALHSIPSLSFEFFFQDQSFIYSSDHLNDPERFKELLDMGILTETRYQDLLDFPWHHKIIYHEAGIPPLHTRIAYLSTLPEEVQKRITLYHIAKKDMPPDSHMTLARFGIENTLYPETSQPKHETEYRMLDALANVDIFRDFPISKAREFLSIVEHESFGRGSRIIEKNSPGDKFFIILHGNVRVEGMDRHDESESDSKRFGSYEYFGEASLLNDQPRGADVFAETEVEALTIEKSKFLNFIKGSGLNQKFLTLNEIRKTGSWETLAKSRFFRSTTSSQRTQLELIMRLLRLRAGDLMIRQGLTFDHAYIIKKGAVHVLTHGRLIEELGPGDFCGEIFKLQKNAPASFDFKATSNLEVFAIERQDLIAYITENPGVYMRLNYVYGR